MLADRLTVLRDRDTGHGEFRQALFEASAILAVEAARDLPLVDVPIETPLEPTTGSRLPSEITVVPVLRAGLGMVDPFLRLLPNARVGHVGVYRDEKAHTPVDYYQRLPTGLADAHVFVVDPMLATGGSAVFALDRLKDAGARRLALFHHDPFHSDDDLDAIRERVLERWSVEPSRVVIATEGAELTV